MILAVLNAIYAIAWLTVKKIQDFNGIWTRDLVIPTELWSYWSWELVNYVFICSRERDESVIDEYKSYKNCKDHSSFDFISAVLKWFISYSVYIYHKLNCFLMKQETKENLPRGLLFVCY